MGLRPFPPQSHHLFHIVNRSFNTLSTHRRLFLIFHSAIVLLIHNWLHPCFPVGFIRMHKNSAELRCCVAALLHCCIAPLLQLFLPDAASFRISTMSQRPVQRRRSCWLAPAVRLQCLKGPRMSPLHTCSCSGTRASCTAARLWWTSNGIVMCDGVGRIGF